MDSKQFAWLYLVEHGKAGVERSYYGGYDVCDQAARSIPVGWGDYSKIKGVYLKQIKAHGVNWDKTEGPVSDLVSQFEGTFADSSQRETLKGILVLANGIEQTWVADAIEVTNVFDLMAAASYAEAKFKEIF